MKTALYILIVAGCCLLNPPLPAHALPFSGIYVFGDSLSDAGNNAAAFDAAFGTTPPLRTSTPITTPSGPFSYTPNQFVPDFPYASNRYTDDRVWAEYFAQSIGASASAALLGGTNFAFGGARSGPLDPTFPVPSVFPPTVTTQVATFLALSGSIAPSSALYVIAAGGNNARSALEDVVGGADLMATIASTALGYASEISTLIGELRTAGAQNIVVWNTPNIGVTPAILANDAIFSGIATLATTISSSMNTALLSAISGYSGVKLFDVFDVLSDVIGDPTGYGLTNVTDACAQFTTCDPSDYLFWDGIHPTSAGHRILAAAMLRSVPEPSILLLLAVSGAAALLVAARRPG